MESRVMVYVTRSLRKHPSVFIRTHHDIPKIAYAGSEYQASIMVVGVGPSVGGLEYFTLGFGTMAGAAVIPSF